MTFKELLEEYLDQERQNVFDYAATYRMDTPKRGLEKEFERAGERIELLEGALAEMETRATAEPPRGMRTETTIVEINY